MIAAVVVLIVAFFAMVTVISIAALVYAHNRAQLGHAAERARMLA